MADILDISQLRTLVAIEDFGGFGRAALALHLSQPTVSQHVRLLERRLEQQLVERRGRRAVFTSAGERLLAEARRILAVHDEALQRLDAARARPIIVGSTETAAEQVLPELLAMLRAAFPDRAVQFRVDRSTQMVDAVAKGAIDLAVVLDTGDEVPGVAVGELSLGWYAAPHWEPPADHDAVPLVAYVEPCGMRQRALHQLGEQGRRVEIAAESGSLEGVIAAARAALGVAVLPSLGRLPEGLVQRHGLPDLGGITVRLVGRRGLEPEIEANAVHALETFFAVRSRLHAVPA